MHSSEIQQLQAQQFYLWEHPLREAVKRQNLVLFLSRMKRFEMRRPICLLSYLISIHMKLYQYQAIPRHPSGAQSWVSATSRQRLGCPCCTAKHGAEVPGSLNLTRIAKCKAYSLEQNCTDVGRQLGGPSWLSAKLVVRQPGAGCAGPKCSSICQELTGLIKHLYVSCQRSCTRLSGNYISQVNSPAIVLV